MLKPEGPIAKIDSAINRTAKIYSNLQTLAIAGISAIGVIFGAGIYYNELTHKLNDYLTRIDVLEKNQSQMRITIADLENNLSMEKKNIRASINQAFMQLLVVNNIRSPFRNTEPADNGGGNSPTAPPGRCQTGEVVVGIAPFKGGGGIRSIDMQCGKLPIVQIQ